MSDPVDPIQSDVPPPAVASSYTSHWAADNVEVVEPVRHFEDGPLPAETKDELLRRTLELLDRIVDGNLLPAGAWGVTLLCRSLAADIRKTLGN